MRTFTRFLIAAGLVFSAVSVHADLVTSAGDIPDQSVIDFEAEPLQQNVPGPIQIGGAVGSDVTIDGVPNTGFYINNPGWGLGSNGSWDSTMTFAGANNARPGTMRVAFNDGPVSAVGGFMNHAPSDSPTLVISAYDSGMNLLESYDITADAVTPGGLNAGVFRGISRPSADISFFEIAGGVPVLDDVTFSDVVPQGVLYRISLDAGSTDFSIYDVETDTWTTLAPFTSGAQMATSADGRLFGWNTTVNEIQEYNPDTATWSSVQSAPPVSGAYGNLEYRANGEWVYTQANISTLHYTVNGAWQTLALPFSANIIGDYDPATDTLVIGEYGTSFFHAIDMGTLAITSFTLDTGSNGEYSRCGQIRDGRFYYQTDSNPLRYLDLSNNALAPVDVGPGVPGFPSCAVSETYDELFMGSLNGTTLSRVFLDTSNTEALTGHTSVGNHSSLTWVGSTSVEVPMADVTISKTDSIDPVTAGTALGYTVRVDNIGDAPADDVVVTDVLPAGVTLVSTSGCAEDPTGVPTCSLGSIDAGGFAEFTVNVTVDPSVTGVITNNVSVVTSSEESDIENNDAAQDTTVVAVADLSITKLDSSDPIVSGGNQVLVYTIEVSNAGPSDATNVVVTDTLSPVAIFQSTSGCQNDPVGLPDCQLGTITAGSSASYTISVLLQRAGGTISNSASVVSDASDPTADNDSVVETTDVTAIPIPTLNNLGLLMLMLMMAGLGWVSIRRGT